MKILRVTSSVDPKTGGPIEGITQAHPHLTAAGHTHEVASLDAPDDPWARDAPFRVHAFGPGRGTYRYRADFPDRLAALAAGFDCLILNGIWQYSSLAGRQAALRTGTPYFVFTHGMLDPWFKHAYPLKHLKKIPYWLLFERRVLRDAQAVCFTCEEEKVRARESFRPYACREAVVEYGTLGPVGDPEAQRRAFLDRFPALDGRPFFLFLGRIHPKKGCDLLLDAFASQAQDQPDLQLVMAGPDQVGWAAELQGRAQALGVQDRVTWTGMIAGDLKWGAFYAADAFVLPSHQENFGISVAEALACGLPALISDKVNIWREIQADGAGLVAADTAAGTRDLLQRWAATGPPARDAMRRQARDCFLNRFHIHRAAQSLIAVLEEFVPGKALVKT